MRRAAKVDDNQPDIVKALRSVGASVTSLAAVGDGVPDLLVGYRRETHLLEVKDGAKAKSAQRLTEAQVDWHATWTGRPAVIVRTVDEALAAIGIRPVSHGCPVCQSGSLEHPERCECPAKCHPWLRGGE